MQLPTNAIAIVLHSFIEYNHLRWADDNTTDDTVNRKRYWSVGCNKRPDDRNGWYSVIAAVYLNRQFQGTRPSQFTLCIGRSTAWHRDLSTKQWIKTIDSPMKQIYNYILPWASDDFRQFDNKSSAKYVDDHYEIVINTDQLTTWKGNDNIPASSSSECVAHFWGGDYYNSANEYDHLMCSWLIWVKQKQAQGVVVMTTGIDQHCADQNGTIDYWKQTIMDGGQLIMSYPLQTWASTMNFEQLRTICDTQKILSQYYGDSFVQHVTSGGKNYNLFGFNDFDLYGQFTNTLGDAVQVNLKCTDDVLSITCDNPSGQEYPRVSFNLYPFLKNKNFKAGTYNVGYEFIEGSRGYFGVIRYNINNASDQFVIKQTDTTHSVFHKTLTLNSDLSNFAFGVTPGMTGTKLRIWITAGQQSRDYQKFGASVAGLSLKQEITVPDIVDVQRIVNFTEDDLNSALEEIYNG